MGEIRSWTYLYGRGWIPSQEHNGIIHRIPFGTYVQPNALAETLRPVIQRKLGERDYVKWSTIAKEMTDLEYLPPELLKSVLSRLSTECGFWCHGEPPDDVILLKGEP